MKTPAISRLMAVAVCLSLAAVATEEGQGVPPLTLDPTLYAEALQAVQSGAAPASPAAAAPDAEAGSAASPESAASELSLPITSAPSSAPSVEDWQAAMRDAGTELADVRLLVLLQRLNPLDPPSARAEDYAAALRLHHLMLAGNARACLELARACRAGQFESGLLFIQSEPLAAVLERRAAAFQLPLPDLTAPAGR